MFLQFLLNKRGIIFMLYNKFIFGIFLLFMVQMVSAKGNSISDYQPGFYIGAQGGLAWTDEGNAVKDYVSCVSSDQSPSSKKNKYGGKLFAGYSFTPNFSLEGGFTYYPSNEYEGKGVSNYRAKVNFSTIDLMLKGILPLEKLSTNLTGWNLYVKGGSVFTMLKRDDGVSDKILASAKLGYGLGIGYNFTDKFGVDLSWSGVYSDSKLTFTESAGNCHLSSSRQGNDNITAASANLLALGFTYKF